MAYFGQFRNLFGVPVTQRLFPELVLLLPDQTKREELSKRCEITDRLVNELRGKLESSLLRAQKAEQSFHAGLEALQEARRETVEATTRHELMVERVTMLQREGERREESLREALATIRQKEDELREVVGALSAARE